MTTNPLMEKMLGLSEFEIKATLKRIFKLGDHIELRAENPKYNPIIINKDDNIEAIILGKVISALIHFE